LEKLLITLIDNDMDDSYAVVTAVNTIFLGSNIPDSQDISTGTVQDRHL
jgi:hypothetical protein